MKEKKKPGRFTLQFNLGDPQQRMVSELLDQQGRHKAQFVTSAVLLYVQRPKFQKQGGGPSAVDERTLEQMMLSIMAKIPQFAAICPGEPAEPERLPRDVTAGSLWDDTVDGDTLKAINDTLVAFQQKQ